MNRASDSLWIDVIYLGIASKLIDFRVGKVGGFLTVLVYSGGPKGGVVQRVGPHGTT